MADVIWVALSLVPRLGGKTFKALLAHFGDDLPAILNATIKDLRAAPGIGIKTAQAITQIDLETTERAIARWEKAGVRIIISDDPDYPTLLKSLDDAPPILFVRGNLPDLDHQKAFAIVGTRQPAQQSVEIAQHLARRWAKKHHVIISGLAQGIDTAAHTAAVKAQGNTVAILGSGVLNIYPPENRSLAETIMNQGALIAEVSPDAPVSAAGLVARNRLITGLSQAVIVVETGVSGGAMHAARFARLQKRPLYAIDNDASGNQALLESGALLLLPETL